MSKSPISELGDIQKKLKRESVLEKLYIAEHSDAVNEIRNEFQNMLYLTKTIFTLHMLTLQKPKSSESLNFFLKDLSYNYKHNELTKPHRFYLENAEEKEFRQCFSQIYKCFNQSSIKFSDLVLKYVNKNSSKIDQLTFSVIPGFFGYFWNEEQIESFCLFLKPFFQEKENENIAFSFSRIIFVFPEFISFFSMIIEELSKPSLFIIINENTNQGSNPMQTTNSYKNPNKKLELVPNFQKNFLKLFEKYFEFCPNIVKNVFLLAKNQEEFIGKAFVVPLFCALAKGSNLPSSLSKQALQIISTNFIPDFYSQIAKIIARAINKEKLPSNTGCNVKSSMFISPSTFNDIVSSAPESMKMPPLTSVLLFSNEDIPIIYDMASFAIKNKIYTTLDQKTITGKLSKIPNNTSSTSDSYSYVVYRIVLSSNYSSTPANTNYSTKNKNENNEIFSASSHPSLTKRLFFSPEDVLENELRTILCDINQISLLAEAEYKNSDIEMLDFLNSRIQFSSENKRILLKMKIEQFEKAKLRATLQFFDEDAKDGKNELVNNNETNENLNGNDQKWDFLKLLNLIKEKYKKRKNDRKEFLPFISKCNFVVNTIKKCNKLLYEKQYLNYSQILQKKVLENWISCILKKPGATNLYTFFGITNEFFIKNGDFLSFFYHFVNDQVGEWKKWYNGNHYNFSFDLSLIHTEMMIYLPFLEFQKLNGHINETIKNIVKNRENNFSKRKEIEIMDSNFKDIFEKVKSLISRVFDFRGLFILKEKTDLLKGIDKELNLLLKIFFGLDRKSLALSTMSFYANEEYLEKKKSLLFSLLVSMEIPNLKSGYAYLLYFSYFDRSKCDNFSLLDFKIEAILDIFGLCINQLANSSNI